MWYTTLYLWYNIPLIHILYGRALYMWYTTLLLWYNIPLIHILYGRALYMWYTTLLLWYNIPLIHILYGRALYMWYTSAFNKARGIMVLKSINIFYHTYLLLSLGQVPHYNCIDMTFDINLCTILSVIFVVLATLVLHSQ